MTTFTLFIYIFLILIAYNNALNINYCDVCPDHTLCLYRPGPSPNCTVYSKVLLSPKNKTEIVDIHNNLRNFVASGGYINGSDISFPEGSDIYYMENPRQNVLHIKWNEELAKIAQRWADQCRSDEDLDSCRDIDQMRVGQTVLVLDISSKFEMPTFLELFLHKWSISFRAFNVSDIKKFDKSRIKEIGDYTQVLWSSSKYVGCGVATFKNPHLPDGINSSLMRLVCNYAPAGNNDGDPVYRLGKPCSTCMCHDKYRFLCIGEKKNDVKPEIFSEHFYSNFEKIFDLLKSHPTLSKACANATDSGTIQVISGLNGTECDKKKEKILDKINVRSGILFKTSVPPRIFHTLKPLLRSQTMFPRYIKGIWYKGKCRCNQVFRSDANKLCANYFISLISIFICNIWY